MCPYSLLDRNKINPITEKVNNNNEALKSQSSQSLYMNLTLKNKQYLKDVIS